MVPEASKGLAPGHTGSVRRAHHACTIDHSQCYEFKPHVDCIKYENERMGGDSCVLVCVLHSSGVEEEECSLYSLSEWLAEILVPKRQFKERETVD